MPFKHILLHLDATQQCEKRITIAIDLAKKGDAHITALFCQTDPEMSAIVGNHPVSDDLRKLAKTAEEGFLAKTEEAGVRASVNSALCTSHAQVIQAVTWAARTSDIAILGQYDWSKNYSAIPSDLAENVIVHSGRPALVIPFAGDFANIGTRCLVAWNGGRESSRALNDAIPMMKDAKIVEIFAIQKEGVKRPSENELVEHLDKYGIPAKAAHAKRENVGVTDLLLSHAADESSDLIVMGAHGHYGVSHMLRGGNTREILKHMTVPVLMSH
ncbi:putative Universal stress protein UspA [Candidatus Terasakiella magnetica]|uniref:Putative Universal stress protein UspA n=1 Tax=Candidatus Terasakiella magnetica TaxID=1867952 RepID=A0A1C3REX9_9PROT|nr:universal stress protein [Candidatus Terasakiella magnetica]SCA55808.1 putative Universal stress protein UspA [Candidatus Terasakiella magnetica]